MFMEGHGVAQNYSEAARWWQKAASQGDSSAEFGLGVLYRDGHGVAQSKATAAQWFFERQPRKGTQERKSNWPLCIKRGLALRRAMQKLFGGT